MTFLLIPLFATAVLANVRTTKKPNIILIILDDQDVLLDSEKIMKKTHKLLVERGVKFNNAFTTTPTCCPSRSSMLTGLYAHNHFTLTNNENCTGRLWQQQFEPRTYGVKLQEAGYKTAFFGKYLNEYNGSYVPPGWHKWFGLKGNSRYFNYKIAKWEAGPKYVPNPDERPVPEKVAFGGEPNEYLTNVITNRAIKYFQKVVSQKDETGSVDPLLMVLNYPAPHGPEDAHPKYQHVFDNETSMRRVCEEYDACEEYNNTLTAHHNLVYNQIDKVDKSKHWFLRYMEPLDERAQMFTDLLQRRRLQTLFSVDDGIAKIYEAVKKADELDNTYFVYTSDHGYHLGQFGVIKGKALPYDFDSRIPFYMTGPDIPHNETREQIILNIDLAPTLMELAGYSKEHERDLDGTSIMEVARGRVELQWRNYFLIERGKFPNKLLNPKPDKAKYLDDVCKDPLFAYPGDGPCKPKQRHYCILEETGWVIAKCNRDVKFNRQGRKLDNNECCCHGCLKKQKRKEKISQCDADDSKTRYRRGIYNQQHPMSHPCLTSETCMCSKREGSSKRENTAKRQRSQSSDKLVNMRNKLKNATKTYNQNRETYKNIRNFHEKNRGLRGAECKKRGMACFQVRNDSFATHPRWTYDDDCYCNNATNGTFFCIRGINSTDNYMYCEFMTKDYEFYNLKSDKDATLNLWYLPDDAVDSESSRIKELKSLAPGLKDELFNCKGETCKPEISYQKSGRRKGHRVNNRRALSRNSRQSKRRKYRRGKFSKFKTKKPPQVHLY